ncbi:16074_t:CDS:2 [Funneliformis geosporum]|nr:16074_t:CDS:2 [Funneliformis geosporum]
MSKNYSTHFVLWFLVHLLLIEINCQTAPFKPLRRESHTSTHIDDKLYILGGRNEAGDIKLTSAASVRGGINNKTLFLHGGFPYTENEVTLVYTFDTQSNSWSIPKITGDITIRKDNLKAIVDDNGKMYLFGGQSNETITNDMLILDTINLKWGIGASIDAPSPRAVYIATYFSKQFIVYLGGYYATTKNDGVSLSLKEIYYYDMHGDMWLIRVNSGTIPSDRDSFSAVLGLDGQRLIIFGGANYLNNLNPQDALYVLNLANYEWYIPKISGTIPGSRYWHQANVIGKYMIISFEYSYDINVDNDILLLDISNNEEYVWTNIFDPNSTPTDSSKNSTNDSFTKAPTNYNWCNYSNLRFYLHKWKKNKEEYNEAIPTAGNAI